MKAPSKRKSGITLFMKFHKTLSESGHLRQHRQNRILKIESLSSFHYIDDRRFEAILSRVQCLIAFKPVLTQRRSWQGKGGSFFMLDPHTFKLMAYT